MRMGEYVLDAWEEPWRVDQVRTTTQDFAIYLGRPRESSGPGGAEVIITPELASFFERRRRIPASLSEALPLSKTTVTRIRSVLGHNRYQDAELWWHERVSDLAELTIADFCARHRVSAGAVSEARKALIGPQQRSANWWRTPDMIALLQSKMPTAWIASQMGLAASSVRRLRGGAP
jgi:hypothetical protein